MRLSSLVATACLGMSVLLVQTAASKAAEIKLLCAIALQQLLENLGRNLRGQPNTNLRPRSLP